VSGKEAPSNGMPSRARARAPIRIRTEPDGTQGDFWELRLYVAGKTSRAEAALTTLTRACELHLRGKYSIAVIDLLLNPRLAVVDQIVALPTLVRRLPVPIKKIIGDLSNLERMLVGLELRTSPSPVRAFTVVR
jgi:circadian clock protein KaiB